MLVVSSLTHVIVVPEATVMLDGWKSRAELAPTPAGSMMVFGAVFDEEDALEPVWTVDIVVGRLGGLSNTYVTSTGMTIAITPTISKSLFPEGVSFGYVVSILAYHREC